MKKLVNVSLLLLLMGAALFSCTAQVPKADLKTDIDSISYAMGVLYASQVEQIFMQLNLDEKNKSDFVKGFKEGFKIDPKNQKKNAFTVGKMVGHQMGTQFVPYFNGQLFGNDSTQTMSRKSFLSGYLGSVVSDSTTLMNREEAQMYQMTAMESIRQAAIEKQYADKKKENEEWLEKNKSNEGVVELPSGLQYKIITAGTGAIPTVANTVKVHYHGTLIDGAVFDSSVDRGEPIEFPVTGVISGWTEALQLMPVGSKWVLFIPQNLAYGASDQGPISPFSTLIFEVELLDIVR